MTSDNDQQTSRRWWPRLVLALGVLAAFVILGRHYFDDLDRLTHASPLAVSGMVGALIVAHLFRAGAVKVLLARFEHAVGLIEVSFLNILMSYTNLIVPKAGLGAPAVYLKRRYGLSYARFGLITLMLAILHTTTVGVLGLGLLALAGHPGRTDADSYLAGLFGVIAAGGVLLTFVRLRIPEPWTGRLTAFMRRCAEGWRQLGAHLGQSAAVSLLSIAVIVAQTLRLQFAFSAIGAEVQFSGVLMAALLSDLAVLISVTPGALGFREAAVMTSAVWLGCPPSVALAAAILDRLVITISVVALAQVGIWSLTRSGAAEETSA